MPIAQRINVNLIPKASAALSDTMVLTGNTQTDVINRALQLYAWVELELSRGARLLMQDPDTGELQRIRLL